MFILQLTSTSGFGELHLLKEFLTAVGVTKEGDDVSCMTGQIWKLSTKTEFFEVHQTIFRISPLVVHVGLQCSEFYLAIVRNLFHC